MDLAHGGAHGDKRRMLQRRDVGSGAALVNQPAGIAFPKSGSNLRLQSAVRKLWNDTGGAGLDKAG
jgi:hypothetical protein